MGVVSICGSVLCQGGDERRGFAEVMGDRVASRLCRLNVGFARAAAILNALGVLVKDIRANVGFRGCTCASVGPTTACSG